MHHRKDVVGSGDTGSAVADGVLACGSTETGCQFSFGLEASVGEVAIERQADRAGNMTRNRVYRFDLAPEPGLIAGIDHDRVFRR